MKRYREREREREREKERERKLAIEMDRERERGGRVSRRRERWTRSKILFFPSYAFVCCFLPSFCNVSFHTSTSFPFLYFHISVNKIHFTD